MSESETTAVEGTDIIHAGDEGEVLERAGWTKHVEPADQGGAAYWRCDGCGAEAVTSIPRQDVDHRDGCPNGNSRMY